MVEVPSTVPTCSHLLPEKVTNKVFSTSTTPINPHRQRLLAAEARSAKAPVKPKAKAVKPKAKAGVTPKQKAAPAKKVKKAQDGGNEPHPTRSEYSEAKQKFMSKNL